MNFYQTCGLSCVMESAYVPFLLFIGLFILYMAKDIRRTVVMGGLAIIGSIPWALGGLGHHVTLEKIELAQQAAAEAHGPPIDVAADQTLLWYIPIGTTVLILILMAMAWKRAPRTDGT